MVEIRKTQGDRSFWRWFRETRQSELLVVAGEDIAALAGLSLAFVAVLASYADRQSRSSTRSAASRSASC